MEIASNQEVHRPIGFAGQNTRRFLEENNDLLEGMGAAGYDNESAYILRMPTVVKPSEKQEPQGTNPAPQAAP